ncbi:hypothetical protein MPSEU_000719600 [Mayamaea pseudoterrestris]|nr:hypothetical protein MPSEU_000719600 [Mayamaea pseudoterrestris]
MLTLLLSTVLLFHSVVVSALAAKWIHPRQQGMTQLAQTVQLITGPDDDVAPLSTQQARHLVFPGGGIFFYWQAGYIDFLRQNNYDLSNSISMTGASAGALCATLTACDVCFEQATELALDMAKHAGVWDRSGGLQGIWSGMIQDWLHELLPDDAVELMLQKNVTLLVTPFPSFGKQRVNTFLNKHDLIACNIASVHIPWFLDGKLFYKLRDRRVIDGSFMSRPKHYVSTLLNANDVVTLILDYSMDPKHRQKSIFDAVSALSPEGIWGLLEEGRQYARLQEEQGVFTHFPKCVDA